MTIDKICSTKCPLCRSDKTHKVFDTSIAVTSDGEIIEGAVDTSLCLDCGFAFNSSGARGGGLSFYADEYDLLSEGSKSEFTYETQGRRLGLNLEMAEFLVKTCNLPPYGAVLDVGCGKGLLLSEMAKIRTDLKLFGLEPSANARKHAALNIPNIHVQSDTLADSSYADKSFDLVLSVGVLEHVSDPINFIQEIVSKMKEGAYIFLSVPNLENNPTDVITYDHLSRFTEASFRATITRSGLKVQEIIKDGRVPMWAIARRDNEGSNSIGRCDDGEVAKVAAKWFRKCVESYRELSIFRKKKQGSIGVYGSGLLFNSALALGAISVKDVSIVIDDNPHMHGRNKLGLNVIPIEAAAELNLTDIIFSANPVYFDKMRKKARAHLGAVKVWPLPDYKVFE